MFSCLHFENLSLYPIMIHSKTKTELLSLTCEVYIYALEMEGDLSEPDMLAVITDLFSQSPLLSESK